MIEIDDIMRERLFGRTRGTVSVHARPLRGGLVAEMVHLVTATITDTRGVRSVARFVCKSTRGTSAREARVYSALVHRYVPELAPRLLHSTRPTRTSTLLFLEALPRRRWPWRQFDASAAVLERVATLHALAPASDVLPAWDYEAELASQAKSTLELARRLASARETMWLVRGAVPLLERLVDSLPRIRRTLCAPGPFAGPIHGDLHPGNVLHRSHARRQPVLIDWARARYGSVLEDVSSWLHSLGMWEPEARRRHDALFTRYLAARGIQPRLTSEIRDLYWLAGASNALAGAFAYHLAMAAGGTTPETPSAIRSTHCWLRVLRRADERLR